MEETHFNLITHVNSEVLPGQALCKGGSDCSIPYGCPTHTSEVSFTCLVGEPVLQLLWLLFTWSLNLYLSLEDWPLTSPIESAWKLTQPSSPWPITDWGGSTDTSLFASKQDRLQFSLPYRAPLQIRLNQDFAQNHILVQQCILQCLASFSPFQFFWGHSLYIFWAHTFPPQSLLLENLI